MTEFYQFAFQSFDHFVYTGSIQNSNRLSTSLVSDAKSDRLIIWFRFQIEYSKKSEEVVAWQLINNQWLDQTMSIEHLAKSTQPLGLKNERFFLFMLKNKIFLFLIIIKKTSDFKVNYI